jgi:hypothetical protein
MILPPPKRLALLTELVHIDLERRLARGERIRLEETYLPRFPEQASKRKCITLCTNRAKRWKCMPRRKPTKPLPDGRGSVKLVGFVR